MAVVTDFVADVQVGSIPFTVNFTDLSTGAPNLFWWDFGDGSVGSGVQNPSHTYLCAGNYSVTLTAWVDDGWADVSATTISSLTKDSVDPIMYDEPTAWVAMQNDSYTDAGMSGTKYRYYKTAHVPARYYYSDVKATYRLDLSSYVAGNQLIILKYQYRYIGAAINCVYTVGDVYWWSNNRLDEIPIVKWSPIAGGGFKTKYVQMISAPHLLPQYEHAGELFDIEVNNGKRDDVPTQAGMTTGQLYELFQQGSDLYGVVCMNENIDWQRIGVSCEKMPPNQDILNQLDFNIPTFRVYDFVSVDSEIKTNYITSNSNVIVRPPILYSGIKEAYFKDGWQNEKYFYIEQNKAQPCNVQFVDIYAETENEE